MKAKKTPSASDRKEVVRVAFRLHGPELEQVREIREMLSLNSEIDAARYLMQRGLEAMSATLASRKASKTMVGMVNAESILKEMMKAGFTMDDAKK
ncbi:MAG TPA: hypothetical protein VHD61_12000 [Lacunisphaera sp.]|nr:hypothetical protein [Lacunisphaera sp.]